jgi:hypothetical protein
MWKVSSVVLPLLLALASGMRILWRHYIYVHTCVYIYVCTCVLSRSLLFFKGDQ